MQVAIKVIDKKKARQDSYVLKNMKREPRIHQMVRHPHIVVLLETLETENSYYMAMELCAGGDLMDRICERKRLEEREVRRYTRQILSAVEHLHKHGIVHRDLKIENFLLDEHNNIKIVDFGLSNTLKAESLSPELLNTQCGSPAYAAPELLAHRKYGPKVDVWSVGVSMFAMLTGTLPFTVEPFNIKHLHQKMVNGEISSIPSDVSKGAAAFVLSLLEPDPAKRPSIRAAMEERWINEGYAKKPLHTLCHKNRLCSEDLNSSVLAYMTETLGYSLSEIIQTLTNNRPSAIMASYHLLLNKLSRNQKGTKASKMLESNDWSLPSKNTWRERNNTESKTQQQNEPTNEKSSKPSSRPLRAQQTTECQNNRKRPEDLRRKDMREDVENRPPSPSLPQLPHSTSPSIPPHHASPSATRLSSEDGAIDEEIAITLDTRETLFPEVSVFGDRELVHLSPPKSSASQLCDSAPSQVPLPAEPIRDNGTSRQIRHTHLLRTTQSDGAADPGSDCFHDNRHQDDHIHHLSINERLEKLQTFYSTEKNGISPRMLLEADTHTAHSSDRDHLGSIEGTQTSPTAPLPRLRNVGLKDGRGRKMTWVGLTRPAPPGLLVNGSKPPAFPTQRQHTLVIKSLRQERGKRKDLSAAAGGGERGTAGGVLNGAKSNSVQLRSSLQRRVADLNLPLLPAALQGKTDRKNQLHSMDY
ncbi:hormonally up-regulated neu tumor-associated kinase homolog B [Larimichthys crocea]|uniref:hormonally up-regulated neu tumor-associated kinase homolog B n=1 Tax=Larimichthys crocea TaxID=215358 RepID=UPI000F6032BC|nr:hormonally up-regulated neu tumor-associated kinase homolog B [Larimichthys crocea]XP_027140336.1 hormonally up-regulated neu tumor-associated kinase homolog B [Larimichthys crocea]XP_027140337.1 hormonally up-regulated neu tumor-associated kinase homolog B [Larimichthys crocea]